MDIMLDIETLGTDPGAPILQIAAKTFDRHSSEDDWLAKHFDKFVTLQSCMNLGLDAITSGTLEFWFKQDPGLAYKVLFEDQTHNPRVDIICALMELKQWAVELAHDEGVEPDQIKWWAKGPDFDNVIIEAACRKANIVEPWKYNKKRCLRTVQDITDLGDDDLDHYVIRPDEEHDAMVDVEHQINQLRFCLNHIRVDDLF